MTRGARLSTGPKKRGRFGPRSTSSDMQPLDWVVNELNGAGSPGQPGQAWQEAAEILSALLPASDTSDPKGRKARGMSILSGGGPPTPWAARQDVRLYGAAIRSFNEMASKAGLSLRIRGTRSTRSGPVMLEQDADTPNDRALVAWTLWRVVFSGDSWRQLRRCDQCSKWFVDHSDNHRRRFCDLSCGAKWWTKGRRKAAREAGQVRPRPRRKGKRR